MSRDERVSVVTLKHGRREQFEGLCRGVHACAQHVRELVVVHMNEDPHSPELELGCEVRHVQVRAEGLPLARARNEGFAHARGDVVVALDVDCIPAPDLFAGLGRHVRTHGGLIMGDVRYLPRGDYNDLATLDERAVGHPIRPHVPRGAFVPWEDYGMFWSLCFGCTRQTYERIGGFDEHYVGYGGEDTDFAFAARQRGVGFGLSGHRAYHQYHDVHRPPLNHMQSIVVNARRFYERWGHWPMGGWLEEFAQLGLIQWEPDGDQLSVKRSPTPQEIRGTLCDSGHGF